MVFCSGIVTSIGPLTKSDGKPVLKDGKPFVKLVVGGVHGMQYVFSPNYVFPDFVVVGASINYVQHRYYDNGNVNYRISSIGVG